MDERAFREFLDALSVFACEAREFRSIRRRSPKRMIRYIAIGISKMNAIGIERRADRASRVARCRWNEYALEARFCENASVGHAVQGHAASQTQIGQSGFLMKCSRNFH